MQDEDILHGLQVWAEARGEPTSGRVAVAYVPVTRVRLKTSTPQSGGSSLRRELLRKWAFSCFNAKDPNFPHLLDPAAYGGTGPWVQCYNLAADVRSGLVSNPAPGATHYIVNSMWNRPAKIQGRPQWFERPEIDAKRTLFVCTIGGHTFASTRF